MSRVSEQRSRLAQTCTHELRLFFTALQFFTRAPIPTWVGFEPDWLGQSARYFPAVGIVVGAVAAAVYVLSLLFFPQAVAVLMSAIAAIALTGALHEDGLADAADGFGGRMTPERTLEIMSDSRIGTFGVLAIGLVLALKCVVLSHLPHGVVIGGLLIAHPLSRLAATMLIWRLHYVKPQGKAKPMVRQMSSRDVAIAATPVGLVMLAAGIATGVTWVGMTVSILAVAGVTAWAGRLFVRRLGGYTGDCLGAAQQLTEAACYLSLLAAI